jgi:hypothetical protein
MDQLDWKNRRGGREGPPGNHHADGRSLRVAEKKKLAEAPILAYPQFNSSHPFILDTDWSKSANAIGGVLSQEQDGQGRVIMYGARKMGKSQANYPATKGELAAILHFFKAWKYYLRFRPFLLRTDHKPLKYIKTMDAVDGHVRRWLDAIANYDFEVQYREGKSQGNADALSRAPHVAVQEGGADVATDEEEEEVIISYNHWRRKSKRT